MRPPSKILIGRPDNEYALDAVARNWSSPGPALAAANRLIGVIGRKKKPEGMSDADWQRTKTEMLGSAYTLGGRDPGGTEPICRCRQESEGSLAAGVRQFDDAELRVLLSRCFQLPDGQAYGRQIQDDSRRSIHRQGCRKRGGPMQGQASSNAAIMKREMATGR